MVPDTANNPAGLFQVQIAKTMEVGFKFEYVNRDTHVLQVRVSGWNGAFGGVADVYVEIRRLDEVARENLRRN